jgi:hypothetical protein
MVAMEDMTTEVSASVEFQSIGATPMDVCTSEQGPEAMDTSGPKAMEASIFKLVDPKEVSRPLESAASCSVGSRSLHTTSSYTRKVSHVTVFNVPLNSARNSQDT